MKRSVTLTAFTLITVLLFSSLTLASDKDKTKKLTYDKIEANLLVGLKSDNFGLSVSSAFMLGEIKSEEAIIPLTRMLRDGKDERGRIVAAIALIKIGSERSTYVVKQGIQFNDSEKVRKMCDHLYNAHLQGELDDATHFENDMLAKFN